MTDKIICKKCSITKDISEFKRGKTCNDCVKALAREYSKEYRKNNPDKVRDTNNIYNNKNREKAREWNKKHFENNKDRVRERARLNYIKYRNIPENKLIQNSRNKISKFLKSKSQNKNNTTQELIGCSNINLIHI